MILLSHLDVEAQNAVFMHVYTQHAFISIHPSTTLHCLLAVHCNSPLPLFSLQIMHYERDHEVLQRAAAEGKSAKGVDGIYYQTLVGLAPDMSTVKQPISVPRSTAHKKEDVSEGEFRCLKAELYCRAVFVP